MFINIIGNKEKTIGNRKNIVDLIGKNMILWKCNQKCNRLHNKIKGELI